MAKAARESGGQNGTGPLYRQLSEQSDALDKLCREASLPIRDARRYDALESEAQAIARAIVAAFRGTRKPS